MFIQIIKAIPEARIFPAIQLEPTYITGGIFEDNSHAETCLLVKEWETLIVNEYSANISVLSEDIR